MTIIPKLTDHVQIPSVDSQDTALVLGILHVLVRTWRAEVQDSVVAKPQGIGGNARNLLRSTSDGDQPNLAKTHQPQSSHAVTNCGRRYDAKAGESGGAHVGPRLGSHPETRPTSGGGIHIIFLAT